MKKNVKLSYAILGIIFLLFAVIALIVPTAKTASFWVAFIFTIISFIAQIIIWKKAFGKAETLKSKFIGLSIIYIGIIYLIVQLIAFAVFMALPLLAVWISVVVCALILGISSVCLITTEAGKDEVVRVDEKVKAKVSFIRELQTEVELLAEVETDIEIKEALDGFAEKLRYSDPMSSTELSDLEGKIEIKSSSLKTADSKLPIINELVSLLAERNNKCKILTSSQG